MGLNGPREHLTCFVGRQHAAQHVPAILSQDTTIVELEFGIAAHGYHTLGLIGSQGYLVTSLDGQRINKAIGASVVVGLKTFELTGFLTIRTGDRKTGGIAGQTA